MPEQKTLRHKESYIESQIRLVKNYAPAVSLGFFPSCQKTPIPR